jgi:glycogen debranching enzyme
MCVMGMSRYGERDGVVRLTAAMFEAAAKLDMRLPELLCGFPRAAGEAPAPYPVACLPQAWAAGCVFMLLQACLGVTVEAKRRRVEVCDPRLPIGIDQFRIEGLAVGDERLDIAFHRTGRRVETRATGGRVAVNVSG